MTLWNLIFMASQSANDKNEFDISCQKNQHFAYCRAYNNSLTVNARK